MTDPTCPTCGHDPGDMVTAYLCGAAGIGGKWTRTPPTEPGWYWAIMQASDQRECVQVWRDSDDLTLRVAITGYAYDPRMDEVSVHRWHSTPIYMPPLPEETT